MPILDIQTLNAELVRAHERWTARQTPQSNLSDTTSSRCYAKFRAAVYWRSHNGNHVTPVKDQDNVVRVYLSV